MCSFSWIPYSYIQEDAIFIMNNILVHVVVMFMNFFCVLQ